MDLITKLRALENTQIGGPIPEWLEKDNNWGVGVSKLAKEAADEIERLRRTAGESASARG